MLEWLALVVLVLHRMLLEAGTLTHGVHLLLWTHELVLSRMLGWAPLVKWLLVKILVVWLHGFW